VLDLRDGQELVRSENLAPALRSETGICLGELYRHPTGWKFKVIGQGYDDGVRGIAADYGVPL
jgi:tellurium resistance protein TerD